MNGYLIPANAKKGTLIFSLFRTIDLILFGTGISISLILLAFLQPSDTVLILLSIMPAAVTGMLVFPIPNYHNVLCALQSLFNYLLGQKNYKWRGWCFYEKFADEEKK